MPPDVVYVGRPTKWGNEFPVGQVVRRDLGGTTRSFWVFDAREAVNLFRSHQAPGLAAEARAELAGKDLACCCPLDQPCHADVLLEIANQDNLVPRWGVGRNGYVHRFAGNADPAAVTPAGDETWSQTRTNYAACGSRLTRPIAGLHGRRYCGRCSALDAENQTEE